MFVLVVTAISCAPDADRPTIRVGSLRDNEGFLLGELFAQAIESAGEARVVRRLGLGGTGIVFTALDSGEVDVLPQYSGTLADVVLKQPALSNFDEIRRLMEAAGYEVSPTLGFNNTYGIGMARALAQSRRLTRVSDLKGQPWRGAVTPEFAQAPNGLPGMVRTYGLSLGDVRTMDHAVAYVALAAGEVDFVDVYTTDAAIEQQNLVVLQDDLGVFARYDGLALARRGFAERYPKSWAALTALAGTLSDQTMTHLNKEYVVSRRQPADLAREFLSSRSGASSIASTMPSRAPSSWSQWAQLTAEHLFLVGISLAAALAAGVPLGLWASRRASVAKGVLSLVGVVQTIPGVALLCFFIPLLGVGWKPAVYALALYALLPIVQGVITGIQGIDRSLHDTAAVLGMSRRERRRLIDLPLAAPALLAGVRVAAVTNVGTAALAALVGAGGFGTLIVTGLALNDWRVVLQGALPSAILAMLLHGLFSMIEQRMIRWR